MFLGEYKHTIDDKGRLTIPAKYRGELAAGLVVTRGLDQNLVIYTLEGWKELAGRITSQSLSNPKMRDLRRRLFSAAVDLRPDRQGRILIPQQLRAFAGIDAAVVVAGMYDYAEIWGIDQWQQRREQIENPVDDTYWEDIGI
ncbi:MAG TPA: transcriptional regulator MraZ [Anaerolineae bacterium]|nr:transcriptional regulator MraZ [Anaerolineae bacterium]